MIVERRIGMVALRYYYRDECNGSAQLTTNCNLRVDHYVLYRGQYWKTGTQATKVEEQVSTRVGACCFQVQDIKAQTTKSNVLVGSDNCEFRTRSAFESKPGVEKFVLSGNVPMNSERDDFLHVRHKCDRTIVWRLGRIARCVDGHY